MWFLGLNLTRSNRCDEIKIKNSTLTNVLTYLGFCRNVYTEYILVTELYLVFCADINYLTTFTQIFMCDELNMAANILHAHVSVRLHC